MQNIRVEVTDKDGWRKEYVLQKTINHVGTDARSDIVLESWHGTGVSPRHLQLIVGNTGCRLVNIGGSDISIASGVYDAAPGTTPTQVRLLAPLSSTDVQNGTWIKLGDFTLRIRTGEPVGASATPQAPAQGTPQAPATSATPTPSPVAQPAVATAATMAATTGSPGAISASPIFTPPVAPVATPGPAASGGGSGDSIGLRLQLPQTTLTLDAPLEGSLIVRNAGSRPGAQFKLEIQGLPAECVEIGSGPILFPNAEREVTFRLKHSQQAQPPAGELQLLIRATSDAYPGQVAIVTQAIQVMPFYQHTLSLKATD